MATGASGFAGAACIRDPNRGGFSQKTPVPHRPPHPQEETSPSRGEGRGSGPPQLCCSQGPTEGTQLRSPHPALEERLSSSVGSGHGQQAATGSDGRQRAAAHPLRGWKHREKRRAAPAVVPALIPEPQPFPRLLLLCRDNIIAALSVSVQSCLPPPRPACCAGSAPLLSPHAGLPAVLPQKTLLPHSLPARTWPRVGADRDSLPHAASCSQMCPCLLQLVACG